MKTHHWLGRIAAKAERKENTIITYWSRGRGIDKAKQSKALHPKYTVLQLTSNSIQCLQSSYTNTTNSNNDKSIIMSSMDEFEKMKVQVRRHIFRRLLPRLTLTLTLSVFHFPVLNSSLNSLFVSPL